MIIEIIQLSDYRKPVPRGPSWFVLEVMRRNEGESGSHLSISWP
jgi:hypothetical protein